MFSLVIMLKNTKLETIYYIFLKPPSPNTKTKRETTESILIDSFKMTQQKKSQNARHYRELLLHKTPPLKLSIGHQPNAVIKIPYLIG